MMTPESPDEWRAVNEAVDWDDRKMLAEAYQNAGGRMDSLSEDVYDGLIAVARFGALIAYRHEHEERVLTVRHAVEPWWCGAGGVVGIR